eukprot:9068308-Heterocapsa_arctica.AAC.1
MEGKDLEEQRKHWHESSEKYLGMVEGKVGQDYIVTGKDISFVENAVSAPQDQSEGFAIAEEMRKNQ